MLKRFLSSGMVFVFFVSSIIGPNVAQAQAVFNLPQPGKMVGLSESFLPVVLKGVSIHPEDPLLFDFIVDHGQAGLKGQALTDETTKLVKYFLAGLAVPEKELWVNLSPKEKDRIMADSLSHTDVGRDMLTQDYILKQVTSTLMYPEKDLGRKFWDEVYKRTYQQFGSAEVPVDTFNKVWIMPSEATVYQNGNHAFVASGHLKVMLESDYAATQSTSQVAQPPAKWSEGRANEATDNLTVSSATLELAKDVVREVIIPVLEKEVNEGKNFAALRQVFQSMILSGWYKNALKESLLAQVYANKNKVGGIEIAEKDAKEKVYAQYMEAYQKGVYNYVKEEFDRNTQETMPRKYFSGGITDLAMAPKVTRDMAEAAKIKVDNAQKLTYRMQVDAAAVTDVTKGVLPRINPTKTMAWGELTAFAKRVKFDLRSMFSGDPARAQRMTIALNPEFQVDFSKNLVSQPVLWGLLYLAKEAGLEESIAQMFSGEKINETENRAVLHTALRNVGRDAQSGKLVAINGPVVVDGQDVMPEVIAVLEKMETFIAKVYSGEWKGFSGKKIKNVVNIGIGGSDLGPKMAVEALRPYKAGDVEAYFVSNVDGTAAAELMKKLDPEETLVVIVSKTFTTQETMQNAETFRAWMLDAYKGNPQVIKKHFVACSTAKDLVTKFGIDPQNMFEFWDWVGGRYSMWSAVGLVLATYIGFDNFLQLLEGGREADDHFRKKSFGDNIPVLKALLNVWYGNFMGVRSFAILPYDQYLNLFPAFAQQFFMESLGKSVDRNGNFVDYRTGLSIFGSAGTDGQHSFYQMFHQGTDIMPADFIGVVTSHNPLPGHHDKFYSNFVAQTEALAFGVTMEEAKERLKAKYAGAELDWHAANQTFAGNKPTTSILIDKMTPRTLGNLVAMYEHQIFTESVILNIFAFDQWGVQEGKLVAVKKVLPAMEGLDKRAVVVRVSASGEWAIRKFVEARQKALSDAAQVDFQQEFYSKLLPTVDGFRDIMDAVLKNTLSKDQRQSLILALARYEASQALTGEQASQVARLKEAIPVTSHAMSWKDIKGSPERWLPLARDVKLEDLNQDMFRDYDYRYVKKNVPLNPEIVFLQTLIWAKMALNKAVAGGIKTRDVLIARDARKIEPEIVDAQVAALRYAGLNVVFVGDEPNCVTSYSWAVQSREWLMTIFNTASHVSQPEDVVVRGFKVTQLGVLGGNVLSLTTKEIKQESLVLIKELLADKTGLDKMKAASPGALTRASIEADTIRFNTAVGLTAANNGSLYQLGMDIKQKDAQGVVDALLKKFDGDKPLAGLKVVVEGSHTPSGPIAARVFGSLGAEVEALNLDVQEISGLHNADPSIAKNLEDLKKRIIATKADFGIAFDLDGDRGAILIPERHADGSIKAFHMLSPDNLLGVLMPSLKGSWGYGDSGKKLGVIRDVLGTYGVNDSAKESGVEMFQTDAGYVYLKALKEKMEPQGYVFPVYGERSGHTWLHVSGEIENPVAVAVLFATFMNRDKEPQAINGILDLYNKLSVPYDQSPRFQPFYHPRLLQYLSDHNDLGWKYTPGVSPLQAIVALGKDETVKRLSQAFPTGKSFGAYKVTAFNSYQDPQDEGGLYRFADIMFEKEGVFIGRVVVRASSNDPTFVMSYEAPVLKGQVEAATQNRIVAAGLVMKFMVNEGLGIFTREQMAEFMDYLTSDQREAQFNKSNLAPVSADYESFTSAEAAALGVPADKVKKGVVLVVDDMDMNRELNRALLERSGYDVVTANDGQQALDIVKAWAADGRKFAMMITDTQMPQTSVEGPQLAVQAREIDPGLPIIAMSGDEHTQELYSSGSITLFLVKGKPIQVLREAIDEHARSVDAAQAKGGIDLGQGNYLKVIAMDEAGMPKFDPAQLQKLQKDLRGIVPVPVGVPQPVNLRPLLGFAPQEGGQDLKVGQHQAQPKLYLARRWDVVEQEALV